MQTNSKTTIKYENNRVDWINEQEEFVSCQIDHVIEMQANRIVLQNTNLIIFPKIIGWFAEAVN